MIPVLKGKHIVLGVSGGIAAYKIVELARALSVGGAIVDVMLTRAAREFVTPLTLQTLTKRPVHTDVFEQWTEADQGHVSYGNRADVLVIAPATAHVIAKLAHGLADDMLTVTALACPAPVIVAPAMDHHMYLHPATQENLQTLQRRGVRIVGPDSGPLASGLVGHGRLVPIDRILGAIRAALGAGGPLAGKHVVVTAGPTQEAIDPIRFLSNRSSGKMGYSLAQAAIDAGATVTLITGPTSLTPPAMATTVIVHSAEDMARAVDAAVQTADALIMAAAVADYRPATVAAEKIKKSDSDLTLPLERTRDILATTNVPGLMKVGFAAETTNLIEYAQGKLAAKNLDLIIANDARENMGSDSGRVVVVDRHHRQQQIGPLPKAELADALIERIAEVVTAARQGTPER